MFTYKKIPDFKIIAITNRNLCPRPLEDQAKLLCKEGIKDIIIREKDLTPKAYRALAERIYENCKDFNGNLILHSFWQERDPRFTKIHFPLWLLEENHKEIQKAAYKEIGVSCHSLLEARQAISLGATYITASHIYQTDCKKDLKPRGLEFLNNICSHVDIPVYALGGIKSDGSQFEELKEAGAKGACIMSGFMK